MAKFVSAPREVAHRLQKIARVRRETVPQSLSFLSSRIDRLAPLSIREGEEALRLSLPDEFRDVDRDLLVGKLAALSASLPRLIRRTDGPPPFPLECGVTDDGLGFAKLPNGRIFFDHAKVSPREEALFEIVRDLLPGEWGPREYHMAVAVQQRYLKYLDKPASFGFPQNAKTAVDAGCYVGFKAIAMADAMGDGCRVLAIEMGDENYDVLVRNIEANGLEGRIIPIHAAISDRDGVSQHLVRGTGMMGNTIAQAEFAVETGREVRTRSLASIFEKCDLQAIDYLNIQLNGAEPLALAGLGDYINRVRTYFVACPYAVNGRPIRPQIVEPLKASGYEILEEGKEGRVIAFRR